MNNIEGVVMVAFINLMAFTGIVGAIYFLVRCLQKRKDRKKQ